MSIDRNGVARAYDLEVGKLISTSPPLPGSRSSIIFCCNGRGYVTGSDDGTLRLFDIANGRQLALLAKLPSGIRQMENSLDGKSIVILTNDGKLYSFQTIQIGEADQQAVQSIYNTLTSRAPLSKADLENDINQLALITLGKNITDPEKRPKKEHHKQAELARQYLMKKWHSKALANVKNIGSNKSGSQLSTAIKRYAKLELKGLERTFTDHTDRVEKVASDFQRKRIATGGWDGNLIVRSLEHNKIIAQKNFGKHTPIPIAFLNDGQTLVIKLFGDQSGNSKIALFDINNSEIKKSFDNYRSLQISSDKKRLGMIPVENTPVPAQVFKTGPQLMKGEPFWTHTLPRGAKITYGNELDHAAIISKKQDSLKIVEIRKKPDRRADRQLQFAMAGQDRYGQNQN